MLVSGHGLKMFCEISVAGGGLKPLQSPCKYAPDTNLRVFMKPG